MIIVKILLFILVMIGGTFLGVLLDDKIGFKVAEGIPRWAVIVHNTTLGLYFVVLYLVMSWKYRNRGKWYLTFTWHNDFEPRGGVTEHEEIPLNAATEDEAIAEAKVKAESKEKVKTSCGFMPVPQHYGVIYKIPLQ